VTINEAMLLCRMKDDHPHSANEIAEFIRLSNPRISKIITYTKREDGSYAKWGQRTRENDLYTLDRREKGNENHNRTAYPFK